MPSETSGSFSMDTAAIRGSACVLIACLAWCLLTGAHACFAATGAVVSLPVARGKPSPTGLSISVDTTWVAGFGYRPIRVTVTSPTPTTADQTITFRFKAGGWSDTPSLSVDQDIEMPAGSSAVSAIVSTPQFEQWNQVYWDVLVDGVFDEALSLEAFSRQNRGFGLMGSGGDLGVPRVLMVGSGTAQTQGGSGPAPLLKMLESGLSNIQINGRGMGSFQGGGDGSVSININGKSISVGNDFAQLVSESSVARAIDALPSRWIDYSAIDIACLNRDDLLTVQTRRPAAYSALMQWVSAGGNLWIYGAGDAWSDLSEIESTVGMETNEPDSGLSIRKRGWKPLDTLMLSTAALEDSMGEYSYETPFDVRKLTARSADEVIWKPFKMGCVFVSTQAFGGAEDVQVMLCSAALLRQANWTRRHGLEPTAPNLDFANWLIPGVGLAPVTEFRILITLFFVLIGPINYWLLKRWGRLYLLVLTVPLAAIAVTLALFGYALVADGLGTRVRARSLTLLDQTNGNAVCWSRLSYYAGLAPSGGLTFPEDVAVYPIPSGQMSGFGYSVDTKTLPRTMQWAGEQYMTAGWLNSRTPTQYLTIASRPSGRHLDIDSNKAGGLNITNRLGSEIELLIVRNSSGSLFWGESVTEDADVLLEAVPETDAAIRLRRIFADNEPTYPPGYDAPNSFGRRRNGRRRRFSNSGMGGVQLSHGYLGQKLRAIVSPDGSRTRPINIDDRGYLAITKTGPEVEMGVSNYSEEASFHVILGKW